MRVYKGAGRNFSRGGIQASPGEGSQPFLSNSGGGLTAIFDRINGQKERIRGSCMEVHGPSLPMAVYAYAYGRLSSCSQISDDDVSSDDDSWIAVKVQWSSKQDDDEGTRASQQVR